MKMNYIQDAIKLHNLHSRNQIISTKMNGREDTIGHLHEMMHNHDRRRRNTHRDECKHPKSQARPCVHQM